MWEHGPVSDTEKIFYESEARFVESSAQHFRALASIAATELGFLLTALTLAGTNELAKNFLVSHSSYVILVSIFLVISLLFGSLQGRFVSLALQQGNRANFLPQDARVSLSQAHALGKINFSQEQINELLAIADDGGARSTKRSKRYSKLNHWFGRIATISFALSNVIAISFILTLLRSV